jgi:VanZ family protein
MHNPHRNYYIYHFPWQLMAVAIFILSSIPGDRLPEIDFNLADKIAHFIIFGVLGLLLARSLSVSRIDFWRESYVLWSTLIGITYGLFDELHQYFIPGRYTSLSDWIADGVGVVFFVVVYRFWKNMKSR